MWDWEEAGSLDVSHQLMCHVNSSVFLELLLCLVDLVVLSCCAFPAVDVLTYCMCTFVYDLFLSETPAVRKKSYKFWLQLINSLRFRWTGTTLDVQTSFILVIADNLSLYVLNAAFNWFIEAVFMKTSAHCKAHTSSYRECLILMKNVLVTFWPSFTTWLFYCLARHIVV